MGRQWLTGISRIYLSIDLRLRVRMSSLFALCDTRSDGNPDTRGLKPLDSFVIK